MRVPVHPAQEKASKRRVDICIHSRSVLDRIEHASNADVRTQTPKRVVHSNEAAILSEFECRRECQGHPALRYRV